MADPWKKTKIENLALLLKAAIEAQGRVGLMLNAKRADLDTLICAAARAAAADRVVAERPRVGGGQHDPRRESGARPDPEAQGGRRTGHRRVPVEQDRCVRNVNHEDTKNTKHFDLKPFVVFVTFVVAF